MLPFFGWQSLNAGQRAFRRRLLGGFDELNGPCKVFCFGNRLTKVCPELGRAKLEQIKDTSFWRGLCPELSISDSPLVPQPFSSVSNARKIREGLLQEGYSLLESCHLPWAADLDELAKSVSRLEASGLHPMFLLLYDEPWQIAHQVSEMILEATEGNQQIMDWYIFKISSPENIWPPHRDRQCSTAEGFKENGLPKYNTMWIPLTNANLENSCLTVLPLASDAEYFGEGFDGSSVAFSALPEIRALECTAGSLITFSHRLLHWGSIPSPTASPRIALTFACADRSFETSCLKHKWSFPPLTLRLALVAGSLLRYAHHDNSIGLDWASALHAAFKAESHNFTESFASGIGNVYGSLVLKHMDATNKKAAGQNEHFSA